MKLLFQQRWFTWFDSFDIYNEKRETVYTVKGQLSWGHLLKIYDANGIELGTVKEKILTWLPRFEMYIGEQYVGCISKELTLFRPKFNMDCNGWHVEGNCIGWDYSIMNSTGQVVAVFSREIPNWTDTYSIEIYDPQNALYVIMMMIAIDAEKCSRK